MGAEPLLNKPFPGSREDIRQLLVRGQNTAAITRVLANWNVRLAVGVAEDALDELAYDLVADVVLPLSKVIQEEFGELLQRQFEGDPRVRF